MVIIPRKGKTSQKCDGKIRLLLNKVVEKQNPTVGHGVRWIELSADGDFSVGVI